MDLMDLSVQGLPDYLQMAQASRPQMMGNAPSVAAGAMFGDDQRRHDEFLQKAAIMAALRAKMQGQQAEEFAAAGPGRMAEIKTKSALAQADQDSIGDLVAGRKAKNASGVTEARAKEFKAAMDEVGRYADAWDKADEEGKNFLHEQIKQEGLRFGKHDLGAMPVAQLDQFMKHLRTMRMNDPSMVKAREANETKLNVADVNAKGRVTVQSMKDSLARALQNVKHAHGMDPKNAVEAIQQQWASRGYDSLSTDQKAVLQYNAMIKTYGAEAGIAKAPGKTTINPTTGNIETNKPTPPARPTPQAAQEAASGKKVPSPNMITKYKDAMANPAKFGTTKEAIQTEWKSKFGELPK
jgi:hypothetical protein